MSTAATKMSSTHLKTWLLNFAPGHPLLNKASSVSLTNASPLTLKPCGHLKNLNFPEYFFSSAGRMNDVNAESSGLSSTWKYPSFRSIQQKMVALGLMLVQI